MKSHYTYKDIINLEYFLHRDSENDTSRKQKRDRTIFLQLEKEYGQGVVQSYTTSKLLIHWVRQRVDAEFSSQQERSPGAVVEDSLKVTTLLAVFIGAMAGGMGGLAFFTYTGTTPVNVFQFLLIFLGSQLVLTTIWLLAALLRKLGPGGSLPSLYSSLFFGMVKRISNTLQKRWMRHVDAQKRSDVSQVMGILKSRNKLYNSLFYWPFFCLSQFIGLGFNAMLLLITLFKVTTTDLAFGWQSTIQISDQAIFKVVQAIGIPWSWFLESGIPTLEEIEGSRIILKDGIYHLSTSDLVAWWPFLVLSLLVYGLFFRILLLGFGQHMSIRRLDNLTLDTPAYSSLLRRMKTPIVSTQAPPEQKEVPQPSIKQTTAKEEPERLPELVPQIVLIADDIYETYDGDELNNLLTHHGLRAESIHPFQQSYEDDQRLKESIGDYGWHQDRGIFIVMEGWMVPLVDFLTYLGEIREKTLANTNITVALTGRPTETVFTPLKSQEMQIWKAKIDALGDPYLNLISIA